MNKIRRLAYLFRYPYLPSKFLSFSLQVGKLERFFPGMIQHTDKVAY